MYRQSGNILIYILGAILLLGLLIMLVKGSFQEGTGIDSEKVVLKAQQVQAYAGELERGVGYVMRNGVSELQIRFAWPDADPGYGTYTDTEEMVFAPQGGGVEYKLPPEGINDGTKWSFNSFMIFNGMGTYSGSLGPNGPKAELTAVLPNVTQGFCSQINRNVKQNIDLTVSTMASGCVYDAAAIFNQWSMYGEMIAVIGQLDDTKLSYTPAPEACVRCADGTFHYYKVLMIR